ncbi:MAG: DUF5684 domain-containing protein [Pseudomonadota bacterium]
MDQQKMMEMQMSQMGSGIGVGMVIVWILFYVFFAYCIARLGKKMGMPFGSTFVWAIIPIANLFLLFKLADKPMWWLLLMLIPIVNFVILIMVWMAIAERLGKPGWWGIMIGLVPIANIVFFLMLVFGQTTFTPKTATA